MHLVWLYLSVLSAYFGFLFIQHYKTRLGSSYEEKSLAHSLLARGGRVSCYEDFSVFSMLLNSSINPSYPTIVSCYCVFTYVVACRAHNSFSFFRPPLLSQHLRDTLSTIERSSLCPFLPVLSTVLKIEDSRTFSSNELTSLCELSLIPACRHSNARNKDPPMVGHGNRSSISERSLDLIFVRVCECITMKRDRFNMIADFHEAFICPAKIGLQDSLFLFVLFIHSIDWYSSHRSRVCFNVPNSSTMPIISKFRKSMEDILKIVSTFPHLTIFVIFYFDTFADMILKRRKRDFSLKFWEYVARNPLLVTLPLKEYSSIYLFMFDMLIITEKTPHDVPHQRFCLDLSFWIPTERPWRVILKHWARYNVSNPFILLNLVFSIFLFIALSRSDFFNIVWTTDTLSASPSNPLSPKIEVSDDYNHRLPSPIHETEGDLLNSDQELVDSAYRAAAAMLSSSENVNLISVSLKLFQYSDILFSMLLDFPDYSSDKVVSTTRFGVYLSLTDQIDLPSSDNEKYLFYCYISGGARLWDPLMFSAEESFALFKRGSFLLAREFLEYFFMFKSLYVIFGFLLYDIVMDPKNHELAGLSIENTANDVHGRKKLLLIYIELWLRAVKVQQDTVYQPDDQRLHWYAPRKYGQNLELIFSLTDCSWDGLGSVSNPHRSKFCQRLISTFEPYSFSTHLSSMLSHCIVTELLSSSPFVRQVLALLFHHESNGAALDSQLAAIEAYIFNAYDRNFEYYLRFLIGLADLVAFKNEARDETVQFYLTGFSRMFNPFITSYQDVLLDFSECQLSKLDIFKGVRPSAIFVLQQVNYRLDSVVLRRDLVPWILETYKRERTMDYFLIEYGIRSILADKNIPDKELFFRIDAFVFSDH